MTAKLRPHERLVLPYGGDKITFEIRRSAARSRRRIAIHVEPDGKVLVDSPADATLPDIRKALTQRLGWVHRQLEHIESRRRWVIPREYVSGETVLYLGRRYRLKVIQAEAEAGAWARLRGSYLEVHVQDRSAQVVREQLDQWFRDRAKHVLSERLANLAKQLRWVRSVPPMTIRSMMRQWGSCSPKGRIALNVALISAPSECMDYVLLHELCHLKVRSHARPFYRLLETHMPDWRRIKKRLDDMADQILNDQP